MKGKIDALWQNKTRDGTPYMAVQIGDDRYTVWNEEYFGQFKRGDAVEFKYVNKGKYKNILEMSGAAPESDGKGAAPYAGPAAPEEPAEKPFKPFLSPKDLHIARMSALKTAAYVSGGLLDPKLDPSEKTDFIIDLARQFERYITDANDGDGEDQNAHGDPLGMMDW